MQTPLTYPREKGPLDPSKANCQANTKDRWTQRIKVGENTLFFQFSPEVTLDKHTGYSLVQVKNTGLAQLFYNLLEGPDTEL